MLNFGACAFSFVPGLLYDYYGAAVAMTIGTVIGCLAAALCNFNLDVLSGSPFLGARRRAYHRPIRLVEDLPFLRHLDRPGLAAKTGIFLLLLLCFWARPEGELCYFWHGGGGQP